MEIEIDEATLTALGNVLEHFWRDEERDYKSTPAEDRPGHIYEYLQKLHEFFEHATYDGPLGVKAGPYTYTRGHNGCDEVFDILGPDGRFLFDIPFWAKENEARHAAITIVDALNNFHATTRNQKRQP
jgi:hypothetical protein